MAKTLTIQEIHDIVRRALLEEEITDDDQYEDFLRDLTELITKHFGGEPGAISFDPYDGLGWTVGIHWNDECPKSGGIYAPYDPKAEFGPG